jgi:SET domain
MSQKHNWAARAWAVASNQLGAGAYSGRAIAVVPIEGKGRGVIASQRIAAGIVFETAPVVPYRTECGRDEMPDRSLPPELADLPHDWDEEHGCLVFSPMQFANHSDSPNAKFIPNIEALTMTYTALRDIEAGEEVTIDYGIPPWWD